MRNGPKVERNTGTTVLKERMCGIPIWKHSLSIEILRDHRFVPHDRIRYYNTSVNLKVCVFYFYKEQRNNAEGTQKAHKGGEGEEGAGG